MSRALIVDKLVVLESAVLPSNTAIPLGSVGDDEMDDTDPIDTDKAKHRHAVMFAQDRTVTAVAERRVIHAAKAAGTLEDVVAGLAIANIGDATTVFTIYKNGSACLSASITLTSSTPAYDTLSGAPTGSGVYAAGDVFEAAVVSVSVSSGTKGLGAFISCRFNENPA